MGPTNFPAASQPISLFRGGVSAERFERGLTVVELGRANTAREGWTTLASKEQQLVSPKAMSTALQTANYR